MNTESPLQKLVRICPILPFLAYGLWLSSTSLSSSGTVWLSDTEIDGANITTLFVTVTLVRVIILLIAASFPQRVANRLLRNSAVIAAGIIASLGALLVIIIGPYYLASILPYAVIRPLFYLSGVLLGLGSAGICLKCGELYATLPPLRMTTYTALSFAVVALAFFVVTGGPTWAPVAGGPAFIGIVIFVLAPLVSALLAVMPLSSVLANTATSLADTHTETRPPRKSQPTSRSLPRSFSKLLAVVFVFSLIMYTLRAVAVQSSPVQSTQEDTSVAMELLLFSSLGLAAFVAATNGSRLNFGRIYSTIMVGSVALVACLPMVPGLSPVLTKVNIYLCLVFEFLVWCVLAVIANQRRLPAAQVYGLGLGFYMAGCGIGWHFGAAIFGACVEAMGVTVPYLTMAFAVLACAFLIFSERELDLLFGRSDNVPSLDDLIEQEVGSREAPETAEGEVETQIVYKGVFQEATQAIAERYGLSPRETDVLRCLARGYDANATAARLHISWNTVRTHTRNVYGKLGVHSQQELIALVDEARQNTTQG